MTILSTAAHILGSNTVQLGQGNPERVGKLNESG